jgi:hypothetical protein
MPDLRRPYAVLKSPAGWGIAQGLTVSPTVPLGWNKFKVHITIDEWEASGAGPAQLRRVKKFHLSFKEWDGHSLEGANQPGCKWEWVAGQSKFVFKEWWQVPYLYLKPGEHAVIAGKVNEFVRGKVEALLMDKQFWASLGDATTPI